MKPLNKILWVVVFAVAFAAVESAVVVYLRALYYPEGFSLPLKIFSSNHLWVELARELATMVMLASVGVLTGANRWQRFAYFLIAFGVWDVFYYVWLKVMLNWPSSVFDWDILFLLPVPWIGPVVAPLVISLLFIGVGWMILKIEYSGVLFRPSKSSWMFSVIGSMIILFTFMRDAATIQSQGPQSFQYELFGVGIAFYLIAIAAEFDFRRWVR